MILLAVGESYNSLIYIYTTSFEVSAHGSISLRLSQNAKHRVFSGTIHSSCPAQEWNGSWEHGWKSGIGEGKWDLLPLPNPLPDFSEIHRTTWKFASLLCIKRLNIPFGVDGAQLLVVTLAYLLDPWTPHTDSSTTHLIKNISWLHHEWRSYGLKSGF